MTDRQKQISIIIRIFKIKFLLQYSEHSIHYSVQRYMTPKKINEIQAQMNMYMSIISDNHLKLYTSYTQPVYITPYPILPDNIINQKFNIIFGQCYHDENVMKMIGVSSAYSQSYHEQVLDLLLNRIDKLKAMKEQDVFIQYKYVIDKIIDTHADVLYKEPLEIDRFLETTKMITKEMLLKC